MCSNQLVHQKSTNQPKTNKIAETGGPIKLKIVMCKQFLNANTGNAIKILMGVPEKHIFKAFGLSAVFWEIPTVLCIQFIMGCSTSPPPPHSGVES